MLLTIRAISDNQSIELSRPTPMEAWLTARNLQIAGFTVTVVNEQNELVTIEALLALAKPPKVHPLRL